jgi:hypothetical protein
MTQRLRDNPNELEVLVALTAEALGISALFVEKDFWVTEVLRIASVERTVELSDGSTAPVSFTFKGGTSLSRVFRIIDRFSEDVDLLATFPDGASANSRHGVLKIVDQAVRGHLVLADKQVRVDSSTTGIKRYTTYLYPTRNGDSPIREGVLLELGSRGGSQPAGEHRYRSLIAEHAVENLGENEAAWEEFAPFIVSVLAPERTLFEKLAAVHAAASRNHSEVLMKYGRHFYDIHALLKDSRVILALKTLGSEGVQILAADIYNHSVEADLPATPRPTSGYSQSAAFDREHSSFGAIELGFESAKALIHGDIVSLEEVLETVHASRSLL